MNVRIAIDHFGMISEIAKLANITAVPTLVSTNITMSTQSTLACSPQASVPHQLDPPDLQPQPTVPFSQHFAQDVRGM
jgi:hypothetical protein